MCSFCQTMATRNRTLKVSRLKSVVGLKGMFIIGLFWDKTRDKLLNGIGDLIGGCRLVRPLKNLLNRWCEKSECVFCCHMAGRDAAT